MDMEQLLKTLQDLQMKAFKKGIHSFDITARYFDGDTPEDKEPGISVTVFLKGDDTDEDYGAFWFWTLDSLINFRTLNNLSAFIGEE